MADAYSLSMDYTKLMLAVVLLAPRAQAVGFYRSPCTDQKTAANDSLDRMKSCLEENADRTTKGSVSICANELKQALGSLREEHKCEKAAQLFR